MPDICSVIEMRVRLTLTLPIIMCSMRLRRSDDVDLKRDEDVNLFVDIQSSYVKVSHPIDLGLI